jgi:hypothetical protein
MRFGLERAPALLNKCIPTPFNNSVTEGRTLQETIDIARDVAKNILEAHQERTSIRDREIL